MSDARHSDREREHLLISERDRYRAASLRRRSASLQTDRQAVKALLQLAAEAIVAHIDDFSPQVSCWGIRLSAWPSIHRSSHCYPLAGCAIGPYGQWRGLYFGSPSRACCLSVYLARRLSSPVFRSAAVRPLESPEFMHVCLCPSV
jgi:hypothetical protein